MPSQSMERPIRKVWMPLNCSSEKEQVIVSWVMEMRDLHLPVSVAEVRHKAMEIVGEDNPNFKARNGWVQKFF